MTQYTQLTQQAQQAIITQAPSGRRESEMGLGIGLYRLGYEVCELFGEERGMCVTGPTTYPVSYEEWTRLREQIDAFYDRVSTPGLTELVSVIAETRLGMEREQRQENRAAQADAARKARAGYVYLLAGESGHFKIGWAKEVSSRVVKLDTQAPYAVSLAHCFYADDARGVERQLHARFRGCRVKGEWFALGAEDVAWFKGVKRWPTP